MTISSVFTLEWQIQHLKNSIPITPGVLEMYSIQNVQNCLSRFSRENVVEGIRAELSQTFRAT